MTELFDALMLRDAVRRLVPMRNSPTAMRAERMRLAAVLDIDPEQLRAALGRRLAEIEDEAAAIAALPREYDVPAAPAKGDA
jgi:hypothetical protein